MLRLVFALVLVAGCGVATTNLDGAAVAASGCRAPQKCFSTTCTCTRPVNGVDPCVREVFFGPVADMLGAPASDLAGVTDMSTSPPDLANVVGECAPWDVCLEPSQECVGRAVAVCPGAGARCLPAGSSCASPGGDPPELVSASGGDPDAGPNTEPHCQYVDDVCCPGMSDSTVDLGAIDANLDQSVSD